MDDFLYIGKVATTHGLQGCLKVYPTTYDPKRYEQLSNVYIEDVKGLTVLYTIKSVQYFKQFVLLTLKEIQDIDAAMLLKQGIVKIPRELALPLDEDEYYISDLIGLEVYDEQNQKLGLLTDILFTGSNEVYVVDNGSKNGLLLPAIKDCIKKIDVPAKKVIVHVMEGLIEE